MRSSEGPAAMQLIQEIYRRGRILNVNRTLIAAVMNVALFSTVTWGFHGPQPGRLTASARGRQRFTFFSSFSHVIAFHCIHPVTTT